MEDTITNNRKAGFWVRFAATLIDLFIVFVTIRIIALIFNYFDIYVPLELTVFLSFMVYSMLLVGWKGKTIGKAMCGLVVWTLKDSPAGYLRAIVRETICKVISSAFLFLGFIWIVFSKKKRGWHDYIAGTTVKQDIDDIKRAHWLLVIVLVTSTALLGSKVVISIWRFNDAMRMAVGPNVTTTYSQRDSSTLVEMASLKQADYAAYTKWLNENSKDAVEYAVEAVKKHQITIFGEVHHIQDNLLFLNRIIPDLYHRAGVTSIAMEVLTMEDNAKLTELVTSDQFDRKLAMQIARNEGWQTWGDQEYWDVLETVWRLNKSLPAGSKKMRLVGIDFQWDGPSFGMIKGRSEETAGGPIWEKLRLVRMLGDLPFLAKRDEVMARNVEREIIEKGERGIVWVGLNHDYINYRQPSWVINGKVMKEWSRMGFLLHHKYGKQVFHIRLHTSFGSPMIAGLIEKMATEKGNLPIGFDVIGSPFGYLREADSYYYRLQPTVCFADIASGYVYLCPESKLKHCRWLNGYISREMFVKNKPFYEGECGHKLGNADEANRGIASKYGLQLTE